jgi:hypothetical protein
MTTTWKITNLDRDTADGFVTTVHWTASREIEDLHASVYSTQSFTKEDNQGFLAYQILTEDIVVGWVKNALGAAGVAAIDEALANQLIEQKMPKKAAGLPWVQS